MILLLFVLLAATSHAAPVANVTELRTAVAEAKIGAVIELEAGTFKLTQPLDLKTGTHGIKGRQGKRLRIHHNTIPPDDQVRHEGACLKFARVLTPPPDVLSRIPKSITP